MRIAVLGRIRELEFSFPPCQVQAVAFRWSARGHRPGPQSSWSERTSSNLGRTYPRGPHWRFPTFRA